MKAFLLAAGLGTRLRPYTDSTPKCLMPVCGRPLLGIWLDLLESHGVTEVLVNTHHLPEKVDGFLEYEHKKNNKSIIVKTVYEEKLLGSAGTVLANRKFITGSDPFVIAYADNLTNADISGMLRYHAENRGTGSVLTMGLIRAPEPKRCGIATLNDEMFITDFIEKPENPSSDLANCGIYVTDAGLFNYFPDRLPDSGIIDFGFDIFPVLKGKMKGFIIDGYLRDIGTVESYHAACDEWRNYVLS